MPRSEPRSRSQCIPSLSPVMIEELEHNRPLLLASPFITPLVFPNVASDARDHCANERNFLSWLRLSIYLCVVSVAIMLRFSLKKNKPSELELKIAMPLGIVFWAMSLVCLGTGVGLYGNTIKRYGRNSAIVQSGGKTRVVFVVVSVVIAGSCVIFLVNSASQ